MENESTATFMTNEKNNIDRIETPDGTVYRIESTLSVEASSKADAAAASATEKAGAADEAAKAASAAASKAEAAAAGIAESLEKKQDKLTAGDGISISGSTISATAKKTEVIPLPSDVLSCDNDYYPVFIVKSGSVCTLVVNGRTGKNGTNLSMGTSLIDTDASPVLNDLLPENYRHDGTLNIQVASNTDRVIIRLKHDPDNNNKPLTVEDIHDNYYNSISTGTLIAYTFTWAI